MSILLALLVIGWAQEAGMKSLDLSRTMLVLALIGLPGVTGVAVLFDRAANRRAARARAIEVAASTDAPATALVTGHSREVRAGSMVVRHGPHEGRSRASAAMDAAHR